MSNMSYCRFHNTLADLLDCKEVLEDYEVVLSEEELDKAVSLVRTCFAIASLYSDDNLMLKAPEKKALREMIMENREEQES